jgi:ubiquinone/menaquinone biosynthesis C-methylase UbiE
VAEGSSRPYFDKVAGQWDDIRKDYYDESVLQAITSRVPFGRDWRVADLGAGSGFVSAAVAPLVARLLALDQSPEMLATMKKNMAARGIANIDYVGGDLGRLPFVAGELDAVVANMALHHAQDPPATLGEMYRVLKAGGFAAVTDLDHHENTWFAQEMFDVWMGFDRADVRAWFEGAGFKDVSVGCVGSCCRTTSPCGEAATVSIFIAVGRK